ncbi:unnamed protein product, partial [Staurois parvus]
IYPSTATKNRNPLNGHQIPLQTWILPCKISSDIFTGLYIASRGGLTIWKLGHCPSAQGQ